MVHQVKPEQVFSITIEHGESILLILYKFHVFIFVYCLRLLGELVNGLFFSFHPSVDGQGFVNGQKSLSL